MTPFTITIIYTVHRRFTTVCKPSIAVSILYPLLPSVFVCAKSAHVYSIHCLYRRFTTVCKPSIAVSILYPLLPSVFVCVKSAHVYSIHCL